MARVLVIDDDDMIREVAGLSLSLLGGHEVVEASGGLAGVEAARSAPPDAILLDVMMPDLDGPGTLALLQADPVTTVVPVVFLTAKVLRAEVERLQALGARGVIAKPFDPVALAPELGRLLGW
ncbi:MAG: response regulator containing a CheY-like receiver domain and an domain [Frankiales bacterium]|nr:response regulator containing a CheY-like receiver domain and an domain [Frankiales bacterium]